MSEPNDQDLSHPLEQVTGERDVHPEEDPDQQQNEEAAAGTGAGEQQAAGEPADGDTA
ncbi:hypothetical protein [Streptomyces sp. NPDC006193]|uniref:hypothetical protein n=1 Tax=Streptomyces sp. NPDC006193 TaxID=3155717 RepID=UPI00339EEE7D